MAFPEKLEQARKSIAEDLKNWLDSKHSFFLEKSRLESESCCQTPKKSQGRKNRARFRKKPLGVRKIFPDAKKLGGDVKFWLDSKNSSEPEG